MAEITASMVKELRNKTNAGMMECKKALTEANGDIEQAEVILRKRGIAVAAKRAGRAAKEGVVASVISSDGKIGSLVEVNCETDFVARNETFTGFADQLAQWVTEDKALVQDGLRVIDEEALKTPFGELSLGETITSLVTQTGENVVFQRAARFQSASGRVVSYIHMGAKVGVLVEMNAPAEVLAKPEFDNVSKDVTLQIAASAPPYLTRDEVPAQALEQEREVYRSQMAGKPDNILDKIIEGKLRKFYSEVCLVDQPFVKEQEISIGKYLEQQGKALGGPIEIVRFVRFQVGQEND
ncbi:MAG TPA: elongation factor Ts [Verrucomicrobia bacterium]|jgi:elongation factor Ts|nr:elongation factor Ts [Verrucomicrobiota bacterium]